MHRAHEQKAAAIPAVVVEDLPGFRPAAFVLGLSFWRSSLGARALPSLRAWGTAAQ
jgi:hypothetical protein